MSEAPPKFKTLSRLRQTAGLRRLFAETRLHAADLVLPVFFAEQDSDAGPIEALPGVSRHTISEAGDIARRAHDAGIGGVIAFGVPANKDAQGTAASTADGATANALRAMRAAAPDLALMADVCLCQYTDHGHCTIFDGTTRNLPATLDRYAEAAVTYAEAGADVVAPSGMIDGQVAAIRAGLDRANHAHTALLSYAVKHASAWYGPFRDAAGSTPAFGDRRTHQMPAGNAREAIREALQDEAEGADALMVKPAGTNLDTLARLTDASDLPLAAYQVSGEYASIRHLAAASGDSERDLLLESLMAIRRAGASVILTYGALDAAGWLANQA
ncbi:MAG: porphobilinogen synthase [Planctomycetota bacterium]